MNVTYQGRPCKRGHSGIRYSKNRDCVECTAMRTKATFSSDWYEKNRQKIVDRATAFKKANPHSYKAADVRRRIRRKQACIQLTAEQKQQMNEIYRSCPEGYHVDHIIPLMGKTVCGLHVPWNLQHLPKLENLRKSNLLQDSFC